MRYRAHTQGGCRPEERGGGEQDTLQAKLNRQLLQAGALNAYFSSSSETAMHLQSYTIPLMTTNGTDSWHDFKAHVHGAAMGLLELKHVCGTDELPKL